MFKISLKRNVSTQIYLSQIGEIIPTKNIQASISGFSSLYEFQASYNKTKSRKFICCEK